MADSWGNRRWLVTGASSGFGREFALAVLERGGTVLAGARDTTAIADLVERGEGRIQPITLDVTNASHIERACAAAVENGGIDVLVNNAGYGFVGGVEESSDAEVRAQFETNFFGAAALTRGVLPILREHRGGYVVNISSLAGVCAFASTGWYSASKFALEGLTEAVALEGADFGIRALIVEPGAFNTDFGVRSLRRPAAPLGIYPSVVQHDVQRQARDWSAAYDPARGVRAILAAMDSDKPPLRLLLGESATQLAEAALGDRLEELRAWRDVAALPD